MQLYGSFVQSMLHRNRSHDIHPIGGVLPSPLSNVVTHVINTINNGSSFSISDKIQQVCRRRLKCEEEKNGGTDGRTTDVK
jgi:hypothetical protein